MLSARRGATTDSILVRICGVVEVCLARFGRWTLQPNNPDLSAAAGLLTTILGIVVAFFPAKQITSIWKYEASMFGITLGFIALAVFFFYGYSHLKTPDAKIASGEALLAEAGGSLCPVEYKTEVKTYQMFINGEWVASKTNKTFPVYDPSTEEIIAQVPDANAEDVNRAVTAARAAFDEGPWATSTAQERGRILFRLAEKNSPEFARASRTGMSQYRQADRRSRIRHQRSRDLLRILRRPGYKSCRLCESRS